MMDIAANKPSKGLILNLPPASGKSILFSKLAPIYLWIIAPHLRVFCGSMNSSLAHGFATDSRRLIESPEFQFYFPMKLVSDQNTKGKFQNESGGSRTSQGSEAPVLGGHYQLQILDDIECHADLYSEVETARVNSFVTQQLSSRTGNYKGFQRWLINQRLGLNDITAHVFDPEYYDKIVLPAEINEFCTAPSLYDESGLLAPLLLSKGRIERLKSQSELGADQFDCEYNQRPIAVTGTAIRANMFDLIDPDEFEKIRGNKPIYTFWDSAETDNKKNDPTGGLACCKIDNNVYIFALFNQWLTFVPLKSAIYNWITSLTGFDDRTRNFFEPKSSGKSLLDDLKHNSHLLIKASPAPTESKRQRMNGISARIEAGKVKLVKGAWNTQFLADVTGRSKHDEFSDILCMICNELLSIKHDGDYSKNFPSMFERPIEQTKAFQIWNT
jgi:phage terminase large subunit-like protein